MSWSKLKTIIILILLLLNLFLLGLVGFIRIRSARYAAAALSEAAAVLQLNGIQVETNALPSVMELRTVTVARGLQPESVLAAALLGEDVQSHASGGGLYVYTSSLGEASFRSSGEFSVTFTHPRPAAEGEHAVWVRSLLEGLGLDLWQVETTASTVAASQSLNGAPLYSGGVLSVSQSPISAIFAFDGDGRLQSVSGRLLMGPVTADPEDREPLSVPTALISFFNFAMENGEVCQAIRSMTPAYRASSISDPTRLTPVWHITTDTGDYFLDAYTAEVTRSVMDLVRSGEPRYLHRRFRQAQRGSLMMTNRLHSARTPPGP